MTYEWSITLYATLRAYMPDDLDAKTFQVIDNYYVLKPQNEMSSSIKLSRARKSRKFCKGCA